MSTEYQWQPPAQADDFYQTLKWVRSLQKEVPNLPTGKLRESLELEIKILLDKSHPLQDRITELENFIRALNSSLVSNQKALSTLLNGGTISPITAESLSRFYGILLIQTNNLVVPQPNGLHVATGVVTNPNTQVIPGRKEQL
jgi:tetrahydromethanopterin S-methyltransferase subunit B